jgi:hypothetical protein
MLSPAASTINRCFSWRPGMRWDQNFRKGIAPGTGGWGVPSLGPYCIVALEHKVHGCESVSPWHVIIDVSLLK